MGFPSGSDGKASICNAGDLGSIPGLQRSPGEEHGNPLQYPSRRIPWTEKPGNLSPFGRKTVGHNLAAKRQQPIRPRNLSLSLGYIQEEVAGKH